MVYKGWSCHFKPFPHTQTSSTSTDTGRGSNLSRSAYPFGQGNLCPCELQGPECHPSQSLLGNQPWAPLPGTRVCWCWWGLSAKIWGWENRSRERSTVGCIDTAERTGVRGCVAGNDPRGSVVCLESEVSFLRGVQGSGTPLPSHGHWEGLPQEGMRQSVATACWSSPP